MYLVPLISASLLLLGAYADNSQRILVLLDNQIIRETHSIYFKHLQDRGYTVTYKLADDSTLNLSNYGDYLYDHLIIFAPTVEEFGGTISLETLTEFIDSGHSVLVVAGISTGNVIRDLASECGFEVDEENAQVIDHLNYDVRNDFGQHTRIVCDAKNLIDASVIVGDQKNVEPLLYHGTGIIADPNNSLVLPLLVADSTAYSTIPEQPIKQYPHTIGKSTILIAGLQARNNARIVFSGSLQFFSDEFLKASIENAAGTLKSEKSGNEHVAIALTRWLLNETGKLRVTRINHHKVNENKPPQEEYTITEDVVYTIAIETYDDDNKWKPYIANDIQLEFVRIDPFVRVTMIHQGNGVYEAKFRLPDVYGVYQFKVDYDRTGYSHIFSTTQVSVRPLKHTEYERFIKSAYPYYAGAFSMMFGLLAFSFVFIHFKSEPKSKKD